MTAIFLGISVACNFWFLFLLLYDRIVETKLVRFFMGVYGVWQSLHSEKEKPEAEVNQTNVQPADIIGKSHFKMGTTRTNTTITTQEAATPEKGVEMSEDDITFDDEKEVTESEGYHPAQIPADKLDETFTSIPASEIKYSDDEYEESESRMKAASGFSFDEIDKAVKTVKKDNPTDEEMRHAGKVIKEIEDTELFGKLTESMIDDKMSDRLANAMAAYVENVEKAISQPKKELIIPDTIEGFDFRDFV